MSNQTRTSSNRAHGLITAAIILLSIATGILAALSLFQQKLYSPIGIIVTDSASPAFYYGISIYITIAASLLTAILIRIALRITK